MAWSYQNQSNDQDPFQCFAYNQVLLECKNLVQTDLHLIEENIKNCLLDSSATTDYYKYDDYEYQYFDNTSCSFITTACVPNEIVAMVTNIYECRMPCEELKYSNRICKVIEMNDGVIYAIVRYNLIN